MNIFILIKGYALLNLRNVLSIIDEKKQCQHYELQLRLGLSMSS
jgi:hypothetical protein